MRPRGGVLRAKSPFRGIFRPRYSMIASESQIVTAPSIRIGTLPAGEYVEDLLLVGVVRVERDDDLVEGNAGSLQRHPRAASTRTSSSCCRSPASEPSRNLSSGQGPAFTRNTANPPAAACASAARRRHRCVSDLSPAMGEMSDDDSHALPAPSLETALLAALGRYPAKRSARPSLRSRSRKQATGTSCCADPPHSNQARARRPARHLSQGQARRSERLQGRLSARLATSRLSTALPRPAIVFRRGIVATAVAGAGNSALLRPVSQ